MHGFASGVPPSVGEAFFAGGPNASQKCYTGDMQHIEAQGATSTQADHRVVVYLSRPIRNPDSPAGMMGSKGYVDVTDMEPEVTPTALVLTGKVKTITYPFAGGAILQIEEPPRKRKGRHR